MKKKMKRKSLVLKDSPRVLLHYPVAGEQLLKEWDNPYDARWDDV